jgi:hypothetical protein
MTIHQPLPIDPVIEQPGLFSPLVATKVQCLGRAKAGLSLQGFTTGAARYQPLSSR